MDRKYRKQAGDYGEEVAKGYLAAKGYEILAQKYRAESGEVDIVAKSGGCLVFVEVKYRRQTDFGRPVLSITTAKRRTIVLAASHFLAERGLMYADCRFDVVEVFGRETVVVNHIENAFDC